MLGCTHTPDHIVQGIIPLRGYMRAKGNACLWQSDGIGEIQQCRSTYQVRPLSCQDPQGLGEQHIVAGCQSNAAYGSIEGRQPQVSRTGPQAVAACQVQFPVGT